jgi:hypothetical protein
MAYTQADIDALRVAIATGVKSFTTRHGDTLVQKEFRSLDEMESLLAAMIATVEGGASQVPRRTVAGFSRGL